MAILKGVPSGLGAVEDLVSTVSNIHSYRLGLDLGTNSIGWCAVKLDGSGKPSGVLDAGVRILTPNEEAGRDPQSKNSLAAKRRAARAMRRRRDRFLRRQKVLMKALVGAGLMSGKEAERKKLEKLDPYFLRAEALDTPLSLFEIGRAVFHLNQRRGFLSNRITDAEDSEGSAMKQGMAKLADALNKAAARTLGEFLARVHRRDKYGNRIDNGGRKIGKTNGVRAKNPNADGVRFRPTVEGTKVLYDFYPTREMIEHELESIWESQATYHPELTEDLLARLKRIIIAQRPLKKPPVGRCTFRPEEERAPRALPIFQRFRILSEIAALEIERPGRPSRKLTLAERDGVASLLMTQASTVKFEKLHKALKLPDDATFNLERGGRKGLDPDKTGAILAKKTIFAKSWRGLSLARQIEIVEKLLTTEDEDKLISWLMEECGLDEQAATAASAVRLPQGHGHIGRSMLTDLVDVMEAESHEVSDPETGEIYPAPLTYDQAVASLDLHHSKLDVAREAKLPYYGTAMARHVISNPNAPEGSQELIGRVPNPTVHIALNQMRAIVNALIDTYGPPADIRIELARELKQNRKQKDDATRRNRENEAANERRREELKKINLVDTHGNRLLLRLYEELPADERVCVYSGAPISREMLFSGAVDIDHILPRSKTLDDGFANKVLCTRDMNRLKGNRPPADVWSGEELQQIVERAQRLFRYKAWRFQPGAMEKFESQADFIARHLTDSQHMARLAKEYLGHLYGDDRNRRVYASPGRLTAMLRGMWGLNDLMGDHNRVTEDGVPLKSRDDHRHHAVDAFVIACTDRGLLQRVATAAGRAETHELERWAIKGEFPEPFEGYREALRTRLETIVISHKRDHGISPGGSKSVHATSGQLHEETAYGRVDEKIGDKSFNLVTRKPIASLSEKEVGQVRDNRLREALEKIAFEAKRDGGKLSDALKAYGEANGIARVRILKTEKYTATIRHGNGKYEKTYLPGSNHRIEIYAGADGKWKGEGVSVFYANRKGFSPNWRQTEPNARLIMRLHKGDMFEADFGDGRKYYVVRTLSPANSRIEFVPHLYSGKADVSAYIRAAYSKLQQAGARLVQVDPIGRILPVDGERS